MEFTSSRACRILKREMTNDDYGIKRIPSGRIDTIIDIGANVGIIATLARLHHPQATIHSFEPYKETFKVLKKNITNLNIKAHTEAFGDGTKAVFKAGRISLSNRITVDPKGDIPTYSLTDLVKKYNIPINDRTLLKIDCEGAEHGLPTRKSDLDIIDSCGVIGIEVHKEVLPYFTWVTKRFYKKFGISLRANKLGQVLLWKKKKFDDIFA